MKTKYPAFLITALFVLLILAGCAQKTENAPSRLVYQEEIAKEEPKIENKEKVENMIKYANIETTKGKIKAELYASKAPISTKNFIELANSGFYNGLIFHRVEPGFVIQTGDPDGDGTGGSGKTIPLEIVPGLTHVRGALGMARTNDPDSATSQFYIALDDIHGLDGAYAVFGKVIEGMDVAEKIKVGDKMLKVAISDD